MFRLRSTLLALALTLGCTASNFEQARKADTPEAYRDFLRAQKKDSPGTHAARERLAELEFERARRLHTPLGYKRFLDEFGDTPRASDAEILLEGLRFDAARAQDTSDAYVEFLTDHPRGPHAAEAKQRLDEVDFAALKKTAGSKAAADFVARHPDSPHRGEADKLLDDRAWDEAKAKGPRAVIAYLDANPNGAHRDEARAELLTRDVGARADVGDFAGAYKTCASLAETAARAAACQAVAEVELTWVAARLDAAALESFGAKAPEPVAGDAKARAKELKKDKKLAEELKALGARLDPWHYARPEDELIASLDAPDPRDRWIAADELGRVGSRKAVDALLNAAASARFTRVRHRAFEALQNVFALVPRDTVEMDVRQRIEGLRRMAQSPALNAKLGILEELIGDKRKAAEDYAKALRGDSSDLFVLTRLAQMRLAVKEPFSAAVAARELALGVLTLVKQRSEEATELSPLLLARTLCGARDDARGASALLKGLPANVANDFPEDLQAFTRKAEEAERAALARLSDAESQAKQVVENFRTCDDDGEARARLADGEKDRLAAVAELAKRNDVRVKPALWLASKRDPSAAVREAAAKALGEGK